MKAFYSDGSYVDVADEQAAIDHGVAEGLVLDRIARDDEMVVIPLSLVDKFHLERGPGTSHSARNATVDELLAYVGGRGGR